MSVENSVINGIHASGIFVPASAGRPSEDLAARLGSIDVLAIMSLLNPVGTIREFNVDTNPAILLGFGTWAAHGAGMVSVALDTSQTEFNTLGKTGGEKTHLLTSAESGTKDHGHGASSGYVSNDHAHYFVTSTNGNHNHGAIANIIHSDGETTTSEYLSGTLSWGTCQKRYRPEIGYGGSHTHDGNTGGISQNHTHAITVSSSGGANAASSHTNLQPYVVVYRWVRTA